MAELSTLARPYARAAFEYARDKGQLAQWSAQLAVAAAVAHDEKLATILGSPALTAEQMANTMIDVCGDSLDSDGASFIKVLAANKRLPLLAVISQQFEAFKANQEKRVDVNVISAFALSDATEQTLAKVLAEKLEREVRVDTSIDESLLGGVLIRAGDLVIDGSVRGRLNKLAAAMNS